MLHTVLAIIAIASYFASGAALTLRLFRGPGRGPGKGYALALAGAAIVLHAEFILHGIITPRGLNLGFFNAASLIGWMMAVLALITAVREPGENLGIVVMPLAGLTLLLHLFFGPVPLREPLTPGLDAHIFFSVLAYSILAIAAVQGLLLALQEHQLRNRRPGGFVRALPPMQTMEDLLFQLLHLGFALLTVAVISGFVFLQNIFAQHLVQKTVLSLIAWIVFGILLWGRHHSGWRGQKAIRWTMGGFIALMLAYFGSKLVLELILHR